MNEMGLELRNIFIDPASRFGSIFEKMGAFQGMRRSIHKLSTRELKPAFPKQ
jgi:hypothetical protein